MNSQKFKSTLLILIPLGIIVNNIYALYGQVSTRFFAKDEIQHMHIAWNTYQGKLIYRDFFEHHGPLYALLNGVLLSCMKQAASFESLLTLRSISLIVTCLISSLLFFITYEISKSKRVAIFSVAIFFMWDIVQRTAIEIRPDLLQNLFWLSGFYLFIKFQKQKKTTMMFLCGLTLGIMLCFNSKAMACYLIIIIAQAVEFFKPRSKSSFQDLTFILLGTSIPIITVISYFYIKGGLHDFLYYTTSFNIGVMNNVGKPQIPQELHAYAFFFLDGALSFFFLYGLQRINYQSKIFQLMLLCIALSIYGIFKGGYPHNCMMFLPFCSIIASMGLERLLLRPFTAPGLSAIQAIVVLVTLWICLGTPMNNLLQYPAIADEAFKDTENNINWVLKNLPRYETVTTRWSDCGGNIFNNDTQFYWTTINSYTKQKVASIVKDGGLIFNLEKEQTPILAIYPREISSLPIVEQEYITSHYRLLNINPNNNCIWGRIQ